MKSLLALMIFLIGSATSNALDTKTDGSLIEENKVTTEESIENEHPSDPTKEPAVVDTPLNPNESVQKDVTANEEVSEDVTKETETEGLPDPEPTKDPTAADTRWDTNESVEKDVTVDKEVSEDITKEKHLTRQPTLEPTLEPTSQPTPHRDPLTFEGPKCTNKLRNGDFEADNSAPFNWNNQSMTYGKNTYDMVNVLEMEIVPGENNTGNALHVYNRNAWWASPQLEIDPSCFELGQKLEFSASIKLEGEEGSPTECNPGQIWGKYGAMDGVCPIMTLEMTLPGGEIVYADVAKLIAPYKKEWNHMHGTFTVSKEFLSAELVHLKWYKYLKKYSFTLDNVLINEAIDGCNDLITNGGGEEGDLRGWQYYGSNDVIHALEYVPDVTIGTAHFVSKNRQKYDDGIMTLLDTNCINATSFYEISANFKLGKIGENVTCDYLGTATTGSEIPRCPMVNLGAKNSIGAAQFRPIAGLSIPYSVEGWNTMSSIFQFFSNELSAEETFIYISGSPPKTDILIDEVSLVEYKLD